MMSQYSTDSCVHSIGDKCSDRVAHFLWIADGDDKHRLYCRCLSDIGRYLSHEMRLPLLICDLSKGKKKVIEDGFIPLSVNRRRRRHHHHFFAGHHSQNPRRCRAHPTPLDCSLHRSWKPVLDC